MKLSRNFTFTLANNCNNEWPSHGKLTNTNEFSTLIFYFILEFRLFFLYAKIIKQEVRQSCLLVINNHRGMEVASKTTSNGIHSFVNFLFNRLIRLRHPPPVAIMIEGFKNAGKRQVIVISSMEFHSKMRGSNVTKRNFLRRQKKYTFSAI